MRTRVYPKRVVLELIPGRGGAELEAWSLKKEAPYFREVFRRDSASRWRRARGRCAGRAATASWRAAGQDSRGRCEPLRKTDVRRLFGQLRRDQKRAKKAGEVGIVANEQQVFVVGSTHCRSFWNCGRVASGASAPR